MNVVPPLPPTPVILLILVALVFSFLNGAKDGANAVATIITSRAMSPGMALSMVSLAELAGPFVFGVAVAKTIGSGVVDPQYMTTTVVLGATLGATAWNVLTWWLSIPTSSSHALVGGLAGAALVANQYDFTKLNSAGLLKIAGGLFLAPVVGLIGAFLLMKVATFLFRTATPHVNWFFKRGQIFTTLGLALGHSANDAPKTMGIITLGLLTAGLAPKFQVPFWAVLAAAVTLALGVAIGSWRLVRKIGTRFYRLRPFHAFNSQLSSGLIILIASLTGLPVSASQVVSSAIAGVGAAERLTKVRWGVLREIVIGWLLTIPATVVAGGLVYWLLTFWLGR
jgi:inorganic phosphate transporter, PiT family